MIPEDLKYTREHEWVRIEDDEIVFGITDHAQSELGDITFIDFPDIGREIKQSESMATVESVKAASDIYAPVTGKVVEINEALQDNPGAINQSPYDEGWICRISATDTGEQDAFMDAAAYRQYLKESK